MTGCNGRVGRHVVAHALEAGHRVHGIDNTQPSEKLDFFEHPEFTFSEADLRDYDQALALLRGAEAVIHLAGIPQPFDYAVHTHNMYVV